VSTIFVARLLEWDQVNSALGQIIRTLGKAQIHHMKSSSI
jgi:hypothetical protein